MDIRTTPYDEYVSLLNCKISLEAIIGDLRFLIDEAKLNYCGDDLLLEDNIKMLAKKYLRFDYECRLRNLINEKCYLEGEDK